jgi:K(+)-stimulated pyrophosphate-energized sodium pump
MSCQQYRNSNELLQELSDCYNKGWIDLTPGNRVVFGVLGGLLALLTAAIYAFQVVSKPLDSTKKETIAIAAKIAEGADAFLRAEYKVMSIFVGITAIVLIALIGWETMVCFLVGAFLSGLCGWLGMKIATRANVRTTLACQGANGLNEGLRVAFKSGSVMAMLVVGFGLLGLSILYLVFENHDKNDVWVHLSGFAFGGSSIALFARVGGGIYTKAADVGADLVGKVEEELDEDSPDNPATIADNVG